MAGRGLRAGPVAAACLCAIAAPVQADTLEEALRQAYLTNPTIEGARAQQRVTDETVAIERSGGRPSASAQGTYTEFVKQNAASFTAPERSLTGQLNLAVPIYSGGAIRNAVRAAETRVLAGRAELRGTESALFSQVVAAYMDVILQEALVALNANNVEVLGINLQATQDRFQIGDLTRTDVAQSEARLSLARSDLRTVQANLITARETYIALVGEAPTDLQAPPPLPNLPDSVAVAVAAALENNPDLIAAQERADAAFYDIDVAGAGRLPQLEAFTTGGYTNFLNSLGAGVINVPIPQVQTTVQAGVRATIPLYQGGRPAAQERQAQARASQALEQVVAVERDVIQQVRGAYAAWLAANAIIASTQAAVSAAELGLEGVRAEQTVGNRQILDVLDAEQELLQARAQLVTARRTEYVAGFTLLAAMGRAEAEDLNLAEAGPLYDPTVYYEDVRGSIWDWRRDPDPETRATRTIEIPAQTADIPGGMEELPLIDEPLSPTTFGAPYGIRTTDVPPSDVDIREQPQ
ncbi:TolC family outer membrane protein [Altericroceibacterium xinjiangense]|uniref:TolC family outer membrane protein n=1 Tax=Altericroceibacterium xinjiangense TaxID=762261 RepID=UPI000F7F7224|nr:TolC family outer membrane protein [Altericroceibacterium xinjiangense]